MSRANGTNEFCITMKNKSKSFLVKLLHPRATDAECWILQLQELAMKAQVELLNFTHFPASLFKSVIA